MPWTYPVTIGAAVCVGLFLSRRVPAPVGISRGERWGLAIGAFVGAMLGAKLPFVLADWQGLLSGAAWFDNGKTLLFGLVGGYAGVEVAKWSLQIRVKTGDSFAVPVAAAVGVGRLACFFGGCCYGTPTSLPWGMNFGDAVARHPTQLYEAAFHLSAAAVLAQLQRRRLFAGQLIKLYILAYLVYRFLSEFIRPEPVLAGGLTGYQWSALALAPVFVALWWQDARRFAADRSRQALPQP